MEILPTGRLTLRYLQHNPLKAGLLALCFALTLFLPLALGFLVRTYEDDLTRRASDTPLVLGAKGDRYDLVLKSLYFSGELETGVTLSDLDALQSTGRALAIPLHIGYTARSAPVVGTTLDYFRFRRLVPREGTLPLVIGDVVLGASAAERLGLGAGDRLITDQASLFNIAANYPLRMRVTGVLAPAGTPDDDAVFVDVKTAWIIAGIGHGHTDLSDPRALGQVLERQDSNVVGNASVVEFNEITPENIDSFHLHAPPDQLPLSSIIVVPRSAKDSTLLKGEFSLSETRQLLSPEEVVGELLGIVFRIKQFLDRSAWIVYLLTGIFTLLVVILSMRLRRDERVLLTRIGCSRWTVGLMQATELVILAATGAVIAWGAAWAFSRVAAGLIQSLT